ncbi:MAG TPA: VOC family protein [Rhizomicrobium sp.]|jgi:catechol 2,3-dioxygenase-like lactoylglutathione lyase family enzyme|nr:VOC family protein [Rhizomicrobium sp.]
MLGYVTVGTNDLEKAKTYFDALFSEMGGKRTFANDHMQGYGGRAGGMVAICTPHDGKPATVGNGTMFALAASSREMVDKVHAKALSLGSKDEGAPGDRGNGFYGAYFRDLDGNKFCVFKMG